ncbi:hypothetical protein [Natrinema sp. DC36]|uniref:hypothetical protein n=1 Tax=Natrinema sp. DC36 TaxID=2878680 RepID=UPI001CF044EF|nr:hypothetical protein [Natrinema sp. DC36]
MGDEPVGDRDDEDVSVTAKFDKVQMDKLEKMFPDARNHPERLRRAIWVLTNASSITIERDADENESE